MELFNTALEVVRAHPVAAAVLGLVSVSAFFALKPSEPKRKDLKPIIKDPKPGVVYLFQFPYGYNSTKNLSPFCKKLETYLKLSGIPYEVVKGNHYFSSPASKMPFIQYGDMIQDDSGLIISFLRGNLVDIDSDLTEEQHAMSLAVQRMVEEHMCHGNAYFRWVNPQGQSQWLPKQLTEAPALIRGFIRQKLVDNVKRSLWGHGLGRHTEPEILHLLREDFLALSALLGKKKFFLDDKKVHLVDITVYALLTNIINVPVETKFKELAKSFENLVAFTDRMETIVESR